MLPFVVLPVLAALHLIALPASATSPSSPSSPWQTPLQPHATSPSPSNNSSQPSPDLFVQLDEHARLTDISYCVGLTGVQPPFQCASRCHDFPNFELLTTFTTGPLDVVTEVSGYLAYDHHPTRPRLVLAFRGTYSLTDAIADLATLPQPYVPYPSNEPASLADSNSTCVNCTVHTGFLATYQASHDKIVPVLSRALLYHPNYRLTLIGHSLGGAVAMLFALELHARGLDVSLTTFGAPRVGNDHFAHHVDKQLAGKDPHGRQVLCRVTHAGDVVPRLPWSDWGYAQSNGEVYIARSGLPPGIDDVVLCQGREDPRCNAGEDAAARTASREVDQRRVGWLPFKLNPLEYVSAHRDYFVRLGLCLKSDPWHGWLPGEPGDEL